MGASELPITDTPLSPIALNPLPYADASANTHGGECGRAEHQRFAELTSARGTPQLYQLTAKENPTWLFNGHGPSYPAQPIWGYAGNAL